MLFQKRYNRERALSYAARWALTRNPLFYNFTGIGGDCTNFVSQCILAGTCAENFTPTFGWYYRSINDRAPAFSGVGAFYDFVTGNAEFRAANGGIGPFARVVPQSEALPADVVQLGDAEGDFYHTLIITKLRDGEVLLAAHSNDAYDRPLSTYDATFVRFLHIEGARVEIPYPDCFENLYEGISLPRELS